MTKYGDYTTFISFVLDYLDINGAVIIDLEATPIEEWVEGDFAEAYLAHVGEMFGLQLFEIEYLDYLEDDFVAFHKMLAHELVHVKQTLRGDEFNYDLPYEHQPHEIEAYELQEVIWQAWLGNTK